MNMSIQSATKTLGHAVKPTAIGRILLIPYRLVSALKTYYARKISQIFVWSFRSKEYANYTYDITDDSKRYLAQTIAVATGADREQILGYIDEAYSDTALREYVRAGIVQGKHRHLSDPRCDFGRRLGWYAFARVLKPKVVVETGVDKGLGSVLLCSALLRNEKEGYPGRYYGTDIDPDAGWLLASPYSSVGQILYGDSIESLKALTDPIDLFINDSDHSAQYEYDEYLTVEPNLSETAVILGDNAHSTAMLSKFSYERDREFLFFHETPKDHWYPGGGIGISF